MDNQRWLIWSNEHSAWWKPNGMGYTQSVADAGRYSFAEAMQIVRSACIDCRWTDCAAIGVPNEIIVPSPETIAEMERAL